MAMVVRSNLMAYNANRQLGMNNSAVSKNLEKLSSGFKINRAADDASGLAISEKMKSQIKGLETASSNSQDGISLVQTAEGALTEVHDMLNRMKELATKSANGTIQNEVDRENIQNEFNKLLDEVDRISESTNFNGIKLLDGSLGAGAAGGAAPEIGTLTSDAVTLTDGTNTTAATATLDFAGLTASDDATLTVTLAGKDYTFDVAKDDGATEIATKFAAAYTAATADALKVTVKKTGAGATAQDVTFSATDNGDGTVTLEAGDNGSVQATGTVTPDIIDTDFANGLTFSVTAAPKAAGQAATQAATSAPTFTEDATNTLASLGLSNLDLSAAGDVSGDVKIAYNSGNTNSEVTISIGTDTFTGSWDGSTTGTISLTKNGGTETIGIDVVTAATFAGTDTDPALTVGTAEAAQAGAGKGLTLQIGDTADQFNKVTVSIDSMSSTGLGIKDLYVDNISATATGGVMTQADAGNAIQKITDAINTVSKQRGELGALQNRLEHTINNLDVTAENMTSANSRIRDTDMAKQMMEYTKMNVLTQSAQAMLAQANQNPQSILQLLQ